MVNFAAMWSDKIFDDPHPGATLKGAIAHLENFCCVRMTHALRAGGHEITEPSDYRDEHNRPYIIRCTTMEKYLTATFGAPAKISQGDAPGKRGIVLFKSCGWDDATGHVTLINGGKLRVAKDEELWSRAKGICFWSF
jgi:hypothetical protein